MPLTIGTKLGPYEITDTIGAGGMGEVYKANDTRLGRTVAIKVLPSHLSERPDVKQRFAREAKTISNLSHPNICTLYDIGNEGDTDYLVMEYLEGETLADRLSRDTLAPDQVFLIGSQITEALDKAHRSGVVHRDLKPGNVMLTKSGVKLLDFGLAKTPEGGVVASAMTEVASDQQADRPLTAEGTILGTFQYMAPEQIEGKDVDARTDIFSLGAVMYEMATSQKAFEGQTQASLIASILKEEPRTISEIQPMSPPAFDRLVKACIEKDPDDRIQTAHDVNLQLKWIIEGGSDVSIPLPVSVKRKRRERLWMGLAAVFFLVAAALTGFILRQSPPPTRTMRLSLAKPPDAAYQGFFWVTVSPDGEKVMFIGSTPGGKNFLWVRNLERGEEKMLPGTEGATMPFWSPDSRMIGFRADGKLKKVSASGGPPQDLCPADPRGTGASWGGGDVILFHSNLNGPLHRVSAAGGTPVPATELEEYEDGHIWPYFLPDGKTFLFLGDADQAEDHHLKIGSLDSKKGKNLIVAVSNFAFAPPNYLLFSRSGTLLAQQLDLDRQELMGDPVALVTDVVENSAHHYEFSTSLSGVLTYRSASPLTQIHWYDRSGRRLRTVGDPGRYDDMNLSRDETRVAISTLDPEGRSADVFLLDLSRDFFSRLTLDPGSDREPIWSNDGRRIIFASSRDGDWKYYQKSAFGSGAAQLIKTSLLGAPFDLSPDGRYFLSSVYKNDHDFWAIPLDTLLEPIPLGAGTDSPWDGQFSPDGRWIAYDSFLSGRREIYVQSFPDPSTRLQVSTEGGSIPRWSDDGNNLYYVSFDARTMMVLDVETKNGLTAGAPKELFRLPGSVWDYEATKDEQRFLVIHEIVDRAAAPETVVLNWTEELKKRFEAGE